MICYPKRLSLVPKTLIGWAQQRVAPSWLDLRLVSVGNIALQVLRVVAKRITSIPALLVELVPLGLLPAVGLVNGFQLIPGKCWQTKGD